jgi:hypothetical protein
MKRTGDVSSRRRHVFDSEASACARLTPGPYNTCIDKHCQLLIDTDWVELQCHHPFVSSSFQVLIGCH